MENKESLKLNISLWTAEHESGTKFYTACKLKFYIEEEDSKGLPKAEYYGGYLLRNYGKKGANGQIMISPVYSESDRGHTKLNRDEVNLVNKKESSGYRFIDGSKSELVNLPFVEREEQNDLIFDSSPLFHSLDRLQKESPLMTDNLRRAIVDTNEKFILTDSGIEWGQYSKLFNNSDVPTFEYAEDDIWG